jgi:hypothetical protein
MFGNRLLTLACSLACTTAAVLMMAGPANALYVRPYKALMLDASGATNNCEAKVTEFVVTPVHQRIESALRVVCPAEAAVRRISIESGVWEVSDDGTLREVSPYARGWLSTSLTPLVGTFRFPIAIGICTNPTDAGTHTWLVRARVSVKQTHDNSDPNPFVAKVDRMMTVTCP